jgi:hypothetical protein
MTKTYVIVNEDLRHSAAEPATRRTAATPGTVVEETSTGG